MLDMVTYYSSSRQEIYVSATPKSPEDWSIPDRPPVEDGQVAVFDPESSTWKISYDEGSGPEITIGDAEYLWKEAKENNNRLADILLKIADI